MPDTMSNHFGEWLKNHRRLRGWTQQRLSEEVDLTKAQVSRIESGHQGTKRDTAVRIARALEADPREALNNLVRDARGLDSDESAPLSIQDTPTKTIEIAGKKVSFYDVEPSPTFIAVVEAFLRQNDEAETKPAEKSNATHPEE